MPINFRSGDDFSVGVIDPFAIGTGFFPSFRVCEMFFPPRKCAALFRTGGVDLAFFSFEEDAVVIFSIFAKCITSEDFAGITLQEFFTRKL